MEGSARDKRGPEGGSVAGVLRPARPPVLWRGRSARLLLCMLLFMSQCQSLRSQNENFPGKSGLVGRRWLERGRKKLAFHLVSTIYNMYNTDYGGELSGKHGFTSLQVFNFFKPKLCSIIFCLFYESIKGNHNEKLFWCRLPGGGII